MEVAVVVPVKYAPTICPATESFAYGEEVAIPTLPFPSITNLSLVPRAVEEENLNLPWSL